MRREPSEEVTAAARRRLAQLGRELERSGLPRLERAEPVRDGVPVRGTDAPMIGPLETTAADAPPGSDPLAEAEPVPPTGRHARRRAPGPVAAVGGWLDDRLPDTLRGRVALTPGHLGLVVVLVVLGVVAAACAAARMSDASAPVDAPAASASASSSPLVAPAVAASTGRSGASGAPSGGPSGGPSASVGAAAGTGEVTVDVAGKVRRPGVVTLPTGSRVQDALTGAGGARAGVDLTPLNLARVLVDGEQIVVGRVPGGVAANAPAVTGATSALPGAAGTAGTLVPLNSATAEQLDTLPGVGPVTAQKILDFRAQHGAFTSVDELLEIDGIGEKTLARLAPLLTL